MVTISTEEYADLIRAQHKLEMILAMREELIYSCSKQLFNAIVGKEEVLPASPTWEEREAVLNRLFAETGKVETPDEQIEEVWGKPHETV